MGWTNTPTAVTPEVQWLVDVYNALDDRIDQVNDCLTSTVSWNTLTASADPGTPTAARGWRDWKQYRDAAEALCPYFCNGTTLDTLTFAGLCNDAWSTNDWRNTDMPHIPHLTHDLLDMKTILDELTWVWHASGTGWTNGRGLRYYASRATPVSYETVWDDAHGAGAGLTYTTSICGINQVELSGRAYVYDEAQVRDFGNVSIGSPDTLKIRLEGTRIVSGAGGDFAFHIEGANVEPVPAAGDPKAMTSMCTTDADGAGSFSHVETITDWYRYVRATHENWFDADSPMGDNEGQENATTGLTAIRYGMEYTFTPF